MTRTKINLVKMYNIAEMEDIRPSERLFTTI